MNQGGFALQVPRPELYYELLPVHQVKIHADRGVKIGGLWYGRADPALKPYEGKRSARGGQRKGEWVIRSDRRDRRQVFFQDPADPAAWHALRWNGLRPRARSPPSPTRPPRSSSTRPVPPGCRRSPTMTCCPCC